MTRMIISLRSWLCFILLGLYLILKNVFYKFWCGLYRRYALSGISLHPNWIQSVSVASAENQINFHLQLMTGMIALIFFFFFLHISSINNHTIFNCLAQITGISGKDLTLIIWVILFILRSPPPSFTTFLCEFMWTTVLPLQLQMLMLQ